jgi:hypothetical protein
MTTYSEKMIQHSKDLFIVKSIEDDGSSDVYTVVRAPNGIPVLNDKIIGQVVRTYRFPRWKP